MPDVQEVFRMATQKVGPDEGALERQQQEQRRRTVRRRAQVYGLVAAMLVVAILVAVVVGQPRPSGPAQPVPINTTPPMGEQIVDLNGTAVAQIPGIPASSFSPDVSRDGSKIVFSTYTEASPYRAQIATVRSDGSDLRVLTDGPDEAAYPRWPPDGSRIAYVTLDENSRQHIFVMNADGSNVVQLTTGDSFDNAPAWSPDGTRIAFQRGASDASRLDYSNLDEDIWVVPSDGTGAARRLVGEPDSQMQPDWSPDGRWLAFGDNTGLSVIEVSDPAHVYHLHNLPGGDGRFMPRWSPDGSKIAFLHCCPKPYRREPYPNGLGTTADIS